MILRFFEGAKAGSILLSVPRGIYRLAADTGGHQNECDGEAGGTVVSHEGCMEVPRVASFRICSEGEIPHLC